jgi:raffinose/stachyose/melibiose transport system substrate-binding protein
LAGSSSKWGSAVGRREAIMRFVLSVSYLSSRLSATLLLPKLAGSPMREMLSIKALVTICIATLVVSSTACVDDGVEPMDQANHLVRYLTVEQETPELEALAEESIERFEKDNPNIDVRREAISTEDQRAIIRTRLGSNRSPDLFSFDTGPGFAGVLAEAGLLYPLDKAYRKFDWPVFEWAKQRVSFDGVPSGVPASLEELGVYYNKDVFDRFGFEEPQNLNQLEHIAEVVKTNGMIPFAFGNGEKWPAGHLFSMTVGNLLGLDGLDRALFRVGRWDDTEVIKAIDLIFRRFPDRGYYPANVNTIPYSDANALFYSGRAAMNPTGTWLLSELDEQDLAFGVGFFPFPSIGGSGITPPAGLGDGLFVARNTDEPKATLKLLDYLVFSERVVRDELERFNEIPAFSVDTSDLVLPPLFKSVLNDLQVADGPSTFGYNIDVVAPQRFNAAMSDGFADVLSGDTSPERQARTLRAAYQEARDQGETLSKP